MWLQQSAPALGHRRPVWHSYVARAASGGGVLGCCPFTAKLRVQQAQTPRASEPVLGTQPLRQRPMQQRKDYLVFKAGCAAFGCA